MINELTKNLLLKEFKINKINFNYDNIKKKLDKKIKGLIKKISKNDKNIKIDFKELFINEIPKMIPSNDKKEIDNEISSYLGILEYYKNDIDIEIIFNIIKNGLETNLAKIIDNWFLKIENYFNKPYFLCSEIKLTKDETLNFSLELIKKTELLEIFTKNINLIEFNDYNKTNLNLIITVLIKSYDSFLKIIKKKILLNKNTKNKIKTIKFFKDKKNNECFEIINEDGEDEYYVENIKNNDFNNENNKNKVINNKNEEKNAITISMIDNDYKDIIKENSYSNINREVLKNKKNNFDEISIKIGSKFLFGDFEENQNKNNDKENIESIEIKLQNSIKELESYKKIYNIVLKESKKCVSNYKILKDNTNELNKMCEIFLKSIENKKDSNWKKVFEIQNLNLNEIMKYKLILSYFLESFYNDLNIGIKKFKNDENNLGNNNFKFDLHELISKPGLILNKNKKEVTDNYFDDFNNNNEVSDIKEEFNKIMNN